MRTGALLFAAGVAAGLPNVSSAVTAEQTSKLKALVHVISKRDRELAPTPISDYADLPPYKRTPQKCFAFKTLRFPLDEMKWPTGATFSENLQWTNPARSLVYYNASPDIAPQLIALDVDQKTRDWLRTNAILEARALRDVQSNLGAVIFLVENIVAEGFNALKMSAQLIISGGKKTAQDAANASLDSSIDVMMEFAGTMRVNAPAVAFISITPFRAVPGLTHVRIDHGILTGDALTVVSSCYSAIVTDK